MVTVKHSAGVTKADGLWKKILSPRTSLKVLTVGMLLFSAQILLIPDAFHSMNFVGETTRASQVYLFFLGLRELLVGLIALVIAIQGSDEVCRSVVTLTFIILSPAQLYTMATSDSIQDDARMKFVIFQAIFAFYLSLAVLTCWCKK